MDSTSGDHWSCSNVTAKCSDSYGQIGRVVCLASFYAIFCEKLMAFCTIFEACRFTEIYLMLI